jgi:hypothetical protein
MEYLPQTGLNLEEAEDFIRRYDPNGDLSYLLGEDGHHGLAMLVDYNIQDTYGGREFLDPINFTRYIGLEDYPYINEDGEVGMLSCAKFSSDTIGLDRPISTVTSLSQYITWRNHEATGYEGFIFGMQNFERGDLVIFAGNENYAPDRFGHIGVVSVQIEIDGNRFVVIHHEQNGIEVEIIPIDPEIDVSPYQERLRNNPESLAFEHRLILEALDSRSGFEENVNFTSNSGYFGDAFTTNGNIVGAIRPNR